MQRWTTTSQRGEPTNDSWEQVSPTWDPLCCVEIAGDDVEVTYEMIPINLYVPVVHVAIPMTQQSSSKPLQSPGGIVQQHQPIDAEDLVVMWDVRVLLTTGHLLSIAY